MPMRMKFSDVTLQSKERRPSASDAAPIDLTRLSRQFRDGTRNNKADPTGSP